MTLATTRANADDGKPVSPAAGAKPASARLDLSLGDVRRFLDAAELAKPLKDDYEEIIVRGRRPEPLPEHRSIPQGLGALFYAFENPLQSWRLLAPDFYAPAADRSEDDLREEPGAFRARVLEPGSIYD